MKKSLVFFATVAFALVMLYSCNNGAKTEESESDSPFVKGQWTLNFFGEVTTYQFNGDMTGKFISSKDGDSYDFTYETTADSIFFTNVADKSVKRYAYTFINDDKLRFNWPGNNMVYDRVSRK